MSHEVDDVTTTERSDTDPTDTDAADTTNGTGATGTRTGSTAIDGAKSGGATTDGTTDGATSDGRRRGKGLTVGLLRVALTAGAAAGMVAAAAAYPSVIAGDPRTDDAPAAGVVPVTASALSCPGAPLIGLAGAPDLATPGGVAAATAPQEALGTIRPDATGTLRVGGSRDAMTTDRGSVVTAPLGDSASPVQVDASGGLAPGLAATEEWSSDTQDLRGLATVGCAPPTAEAWLTAGAGAAGRQERLVLTNPGANAVTADVSVLGREGPVDSDLGAGIPVPARGRAAVLLDALAPGEWSPVVHVSVHGGAVSATLTDTWLDGATPVGVETVSPMAATAARQVVPVTAVDGVAVLRVAVPGDQEAVASVRLIGADGARPLPGLNVVDIPAGTVVDLPVQDVAAGRYAVEVRADVPVLASTTTSARDGTGRGDIAWGPSSAPLPRDGAPAGMVLSSPPPAEGRRSGGTIERTLTLVATQAPVEAAVVQVTDGEVVAQLVRLEADTSRSLELGDADAVWVSHSSGTGELRAAVDSVAGSGPTRLMSTTVLVPSVVTSRVGAAVPVP